MRAPLSLAVLALAACGPDASTAGDAGMDDLTCLEPAADRTGTAALTDALGTATVAITDVATCRRGYSLTSTAVRRDDVPGSPRYVEERPGAPTLRSGHDLFDALYALALEEVRENAVDEISDGAFASGSPIACPPGGCFETGRKWTYVWTRDTSYAVDLGLATLDPIRAKNSLEFKLSAPRTGGAEQIIQDTGTGGSYPVSSDRVVWALGAAAVLPQLEDAERAALAARSYAAVRATIEHDRGVVHDAADGLYLGEQSFLDWREQSYPAWTRDDVAPIASSKALSTNLLHLRAIELAATLAGELGETADAARYAGWATELRDRIRTRFWLEDAGLYATFATTFLDPAPARQFDLLGSALAVLGGVASPAQADRILAAYPHVGPGAAPVIFPQQQLTAIYHNRAEWPFVTAYWLRAAAAADHPAVAERAVHSLMRAAALNLTNLENLEIATGAPWVDDGAYSGPVVNSQRQLWSVAGYVSMVHHSLFGLAWQADGLRVAPYVTTAMRAGMFAGTDTLALNDVPWRAARLTIALHLPPAGGPAGSYAVAEVRLDGAVVTGPITYAQVGPASRIDVTLAAPTAAHAPALTEVDASRWQDLFGPRVPAITGVRRSGGVIALDLDAGGEDTQAIRYAIYRDGTRIADALAGTLASYTDAGASADGTACYAVETCFTTSGTCSQRSRPVCWWGDGGARITSVGASTFVATGGVPSTDHGRFHHGSWGDPGHQLVIPSVTAARSGPHLLQLVYGNGAGPINTGITCAVKRVVVTDLTTSQDIASGVIAMPQLATWDRWADSTLLPVDLIGGRSYRITIKGDRGSINMSAFTHFIHFGGAGGASGEFNRVNIAELKLLSR